MKIPRTCKICCNPFTAIKTTQFFCSRKCFKKDYYLRTKIKEENEERNNKKYPLKECPYCGEESMLDFDPVTHPHEFDHWFCPHCGTSNEMIWRNHNKSNSYQIISELLITFQATVEYAADYDSPNRQMEIYRLPIIRPETVENATLLLTYGTIVSMRDVRKNNRKRILFS